MCGFMVYTKNDICEEDFLRGFSKIGYRGPDMTRTDFVNGMWGFHRLSIMDLSEDGMQPFYFKDMKVVCNGEIFDKYYASYDDTIVDYWMPNKNWVGCDVNDPSARVLSNYGDSGK